MQGTKNFTGKEANEMRGIDADQAQRDLVEAIEKKDFPKWALKIQVMTDNQVKNFKWNPFDITKVWSHKDFPLIDVGIMQLNEIPENYFRDVEQSAFNPAHVVDVSLFICSSVIIIDNFANEYQFIKLKLGYKDCFYSDEVLN